MTSLKEVDADPFANHFEILIDDLIALQLLEKLSKAEQQNQILKSENLKPSNLRLNGLERVTYFPSSSLSIPPDSAKVQSTLNLKIKKSLAVDIDQCSDLQKSIFPLMNQYYDIYGPIRSIDNASHLRWCYCLHILNHALKTRAKILAHNAKLKSIQERAKQNSGKSKMLETVIPDYRDHGFVRPKVLVLIPFRESALRIVDTISLILFGNKLDDQETGKKPMVANKARFYSEYSLADDMAPPSKRHKPPPVDHEQLFSGNTDDSFRIGLAVSRSCLKLFVEFYAADIIIASPLGLRMAIGADGEKSYDYDFLSAIEIVVLDQADVFLMQNWAHCQYIFEHINKTPRDAHGVDFTRIRMHSLNGWNSVYRQTILFSSVNSPEIKSIFTKYCSNYAGLCIFQPNESPTPAINSILRDLTQAFIRFDCSTPVDESDLRFNCFVDTILPNLAEKQQQHYLIYIASYFDFVRIRNYLKRDDRISFVQICEYTKDKKISRSRDMFYHARKNVLIYTERFHFYRRYQIKGIRHILFYQLPTFPHFYSELCDMIQQRASSAEDGVVNSCTSLFCQLDALRLSRIVGLDRTKSMLYSDNVKFAIVTTTTAD